MRILCETIKDSLYPPAPIQRERDAVRAVLLNGKNEIALLHLEGIDEFSVISGQAELSRRDHFELPGGGVEDGESFEGALRREMGEELGLEIEILAEVGIIANEYNLIRRRDIQHFYLARTIGDRPMARTESEKKLVKEVLWVPAEDILNLYDTRPVENVGIEIHRRDRIAISAALKIGRELGIL